jgi:gliding motility-associated-like protein
VGLSSTNVANPRVVITPSTLPNGQESITYQVVASTSEGCNNSDDITIRIFKTGPSIFIPNAFTPNNDGLNDVIRPILAGIQRLDYFRIYNRYGQLVFETSTPNRGWDGRINGLLQASSAFVYQCQAVTIDGTVLTQKGTFTLVR